LHLTATLRKMDLEQHFVVSQQGQQLRVRRRSDEAAPLLSPGGSSSPELPNGDLAMPFGSDLDLNSPGARGSFDDPPQARFGSNLHALLVFLELMRVFLCLDNFFDPVRVNSTEAMVAYREISQPSLSEQEAPSGQSDAFFRGKLLLFSALLPAVTSSVHSQISTCMNSTLMDLGPTFLERMFPPTHLSISTPCFPSSHLGPCLNIYCLYLLVSFHFHSSTLADPCIDPHTNRACTY
jgi:hypothetical protein